VSDPNLWAEFLYQTGVYYQLMLAKLKNYKTYQTYTFFVGMYALDLTSGTAAVAISTISSVGTTATVTTGLVHGFTTGDSVSINNVAIDQNNYPGYNGTYTVTVTSTTNFTYTLPISLASVSGDHAQYYNNPNGFVTVDGITISVGAAGSSSYIKYPLTLESSQLEWERKNVIPMQIAIPPKNYFPRRDDFGIWPIPRTLYTAHCYYHYRDRNLSVADYTAGSITLTQNSNKVMGSSTIFTAAMVGRWLEVTDTTIPGQGYFMRINHFTSTTQIELDQVWTGTTSSGITSYIIGESPEIPEDLHMYLVSGITAGYLMDVRKDIDNGPKFDNHFWTGNMQNAGRKENDENITGGLIGGMKAYGDREDQRIIDRNESNFNPFKFEPWAAHLK